MKKNGATLVDIQAVANRRCDSIRQKLGLPEFSMIEHVSEKTGAAEIELTEQERDAIVAEEIERAEERRKAYDSRARPERKPVTPKQYSEAERAIRRARREAAQALRAERMDARQLVRQSVRRSIRATLSPAQRVTNNNRGFNTKTPIVKPKAPSKRKDWTLTTTQMFDLLKEQNNRCHEFGIGFEIMGREFWKSRHPFAPSLDRVDNAKGYTLENARLVILAWNLMKSTHDEQTAREAVLAMADAIRTRRHTSARLDCANHSRGSAATSR